MVLAKNRIPILAVGIVLFLGLLFTFYGLQRVNAQTPPAPEISWDQAFDSRGNTVDLWVVMVLTVKGEAETVEISVGDDITKIVDAPDEGVITAVKVSDFEAAADDDGIYQDPDVELRVLDSDGTELVTSSEPEGAEDLVPSDLGWKYQIRGNQAQLQVKLPEDGVSGTQVDSIKVYPVYDPRLRADHTSIATLNANDPLPTDRILNLIVSNLRAEPAGFRLLFFDRPNRDRTDNLLTLHEGTGINEAVMVGLPEHPAPPPERTPRPTPTPVPPPAGDFSLGSGALIAMMLAGLLLVVAGGAYVLQTRRTR